MGGVPDKGVPIGSIEIGLIVSCTLEACLAAAFGWLIVLASSKGRGLPFLLSIAVMLVSAWTSLFNIQWLILGRAPETGADVAWLGVIGAVFCGFALYLIDDHVDKFKIKFSSVNDFVHSINEGGSLYIWQALSFAVMYGVIWANSPYAMQN
ncbi:hypothetical protein G8770_23720 [Aestuariicella hydrocarbonica]|uniref:Uncharacterized protein n=1 Tax=Pseudomaricurvus hydrocarbonicus TaxID=1470433 RepID=A0A9E5MQQ5_9GAMM|nr:hypothetical protein [Aestuariicella hydrocarbonica]